VAELDDDDGGIIAGVFLLELVHDLVAGLLRWRATAADQFCQDLVGNHIPEAVGADDEVLVIGSDLVLDDMTCTCQQRA